MPALISAPLKLPVDLEKFAANLNKRADLEKQLVQSAVPPRAVAETNQLTATRHRDLLALVTKVEPLRQTKPGDVLGVTVVDGSEDAQGSYAQFKIAVRGERESKTWCCSTSANRWCFST